MLCSYAAIEFAENSSLPTSNKYHSFKKTGEVATKMLYTKSKPTPAKFKSTRHIPSVADKILDAPDIVDDYCNPLNTL